MGADIDDEGARRDVDLVDAEQEQNVERAGRRHLPRGQAALPRHEAEIERADARGRAVQHAIAVPAVLHRAEIDRGLGGERSDRRAVGARQRAGADQHQRTLGLAQHVGEGVAGDGGERLGAGAEIVVSVGEVRLRPDDADREFSGAPALADARIEDRRLLARIGADDEQRVGRVDPGDGRIEQIAGAAPGRIERRAVLPAIEIADVEPRHQILERENLLDRGEIADQRADALGIGARDLGGDRVERFVPRRRAQACPFSRT